MYRVSMHINDPGTRLVARAILEAAGHVVVGEGEDVAIFDDVSEARAQATRVKTLLLCTHENVRAAVNAMRDGIYGYALLPFVPGELAIMVERAAASDTQSLLKEENSETLAESERALIMKTLRACKNNQAEAARRLDIGRNTLWRKLKEMQISTTEDAQNKGG